MGEVWKAHDQRLRRDVAIKVLPSDFASDANLRQRFEREAKAIARLNHPNICTLYDVGSDFIVMELLEGELLNERIARGPLRIADVLRYGAEIAAALHLAHRAGIVHRDLKPANVMVTKSGAKLLDFGLAKSLHLPVRPDDATPSRPVPITDKGTIVGTVQYMAPEQLKGADVDARTDIFALGSMLYEMTTGRRPFDGPAGTLIAAIMTSRPQPVSELRRDAPPVLEHVIMKCLQKDPDDRWQSALDVADDLRWIGEQKTARRSWRAPLIWIAAMLIAIAAAVWIATRPRPVQREVVIASIDPDGNRGPRLRWGPPVFSPDGKWLVWAAVDDRRQRKLWLRSIERGTTEPLPGTEDAFLPFWSSNGRFIAFSTAHNGELKKYSIADRSVERIAVKTNGSWSWNRRDVILCVNARIDAIMRIPASVAGGSAAEVVRGASIGATFTAWPSFLPDGNHFLFLAKGRQSGLWIATLDGSEKPRFVTRAESHGIFIEPDTLLYTRAGALRARRLDPKRFEVDGAEKTIAPVQSLDREKDVFAAFAASNSGLIAWLPPAVVVSKSALILKSRNGAIQREIAEAGAWNSPRVSRDGRRVAVSRGDEHGRDHIWMIGIDDGAAGRTSFDPQNEIAPVWSPRGDEIAWVIDLVTSGSRVMRGRPGEPAREILTTQERVRTTDWSPDGKYLLMNRFARSGSGGVPNMDVDAWSFDEGKRIDVTRWPPNESQAVFSPDGKWIAYQSDESGQMEIYVQLFPPTGAKVQVSAGGAWPRWPRADEIVYADLNDRLMAVHIETTPIFRAAPPHVLFPVKAHDDLPRVQYDVLPGGNLLVNDPIGELPQSITLMSGWHR
jgi:Tol biopolymer transport system component